MNTLSLHETCHILFLTQLLLMQARREGQSADKGLNNSRASSSVLHTLVPPPFPATMPHPPPMHTVATANELAWEGKVNNLLKFCTTY